MKKQTVSQNSQEDLSLWIDKLIKAPDGTGADQSQSDHNTKVLHEYLQSIGIDSSFKKVTWPGSDLKEWTVIVAADKIIFDRWGFSALKGFERADIDQAPFVIVTQYVKDLVNGKYTRKSKKKSA